MKRQKSETINRAFKKDFSLKKALSAKQGRKCPESRENPDPLDDEDPEYMEEIFETYKYMGWGPEKIKDPQEREEYAAWLNESP